MARSRSFAKPLLLGAFLGAALASWWFLSHRAPAAGQPPADPSEVTGMIRAQQDAWNKGDLEAFMDAYADDLVFYTGGNVLKGREALTTRYRQRYQKDGKEMGRLTFSDLDVQPIDANAALARGRWKVEMKDGTRPEGLFTLLVKRHPDGWRIVHDHTSAAEPPKSP
jgi:uncharacterized protein (TIGR02246 family)